MYKALQGTDMDVFAWIDEEQDPELVKAWEALEVEVGELAGWQYRGSSNQEGFWMHSFRNKRLLEMAESDETGEAAARLIKASPDWIPSPV